MKGGLSLKIRMFLVLIISVPQLYIIPVGVDVSLAFAMPFLLLPELLNILKGLFRKKIILTIFGLILISTISLLWSDEKIMGIRDVSYFFELVLIIVGAYSLTLKNDRALYRILNIMFCFMLIEAITIVFFRFFPELKIAILLSPKMSIFLGQNTLQNLYEGSRNNFFDPLKSGGILFINANAAACYMGMSSFLAWGVYKINRSKFSLIASVVLWISVMFTDSKAGLIFALFIPAIIYVYSRKAALKLGLLSIMGIVVCIAIVYTYTVGESINNAFFSDSSTAADSRYDIWAFALSAFIKSPLLGQGFGGWEHEYMKYSSYFLPPHNSLIYLWSKSGVIASFLGVIFIIQVLKLAFKAINLKEHDCYYAGLTLLMASMWLFLHGFGENFGLIGEPHQMVILSLLIGCNLAYVEKVKRKKRIDEYEEKNYSF
ncbi:O-antigen ligase family protein [Raoultella planticola]|nr:O-antigen ligase family protein [Raoultella planticola]